MSEASHLRLLTILWVSALDALGYDGENVGELWVDQL